MTPQPAGPEPGQAPGAGRRRWRSRRHRPSGTPGGRGPGGRPDRLPVIAAGPYLLRGFEHGDVDLVVEAGRDPVIPLIASVTPGCSAADAAAFVERQRHRLRDGYGYSFVIAEAEGNRGVGSIGLWLRDADQGRASVGYWVVATARRAGAAGAAVAALSRWAFLTLGIPRLELHVEPWNEASIRTAEGAGYVREGLARSWQSVGGRRRDMYTYSLLESDLG